MIQSSKDNQDKTQFPFVLLNQHEYVYNGNVGVLNMNPKITEDELFCCHCEVPMATAVVLVNPFFNIYFTNFLQEPCGHRICEDCYSESMEYFECPKCNF